MAEGSAMPIQTSPFLAGEKSRAENVVGGSEQHDAGGEVRVNRSFSRPT